MTFTLKELNTIHHCLEYMIGVYEKSLRESSPNSSLYGVWSRSIQDTTAVLRKIDNAELN